jgi:hypothetical protein
MQDQPDRRASERMAVVHGTACSFVGPVVTDFGPAKVRDVSIDGIGLIMLHKVEVGSLVAVNLVNPDRGFAKTLLVRVAHVTPVPGGHLVGGTFAPPLTYQELTTLVM